MLAPNDHPFRGVATNGINPSDVDKLSNGLLNLVIVSKENNPDASQVQHSNDPLSIKKDSSNDKSCLTLQQRSQTFNNDSDDEADDESENESKKRKKPTVPTVLQSMNLCDAPLNSHGHKKSKKIRISALQRKVRRNREKQQMPFFRSTAHTSSQQHLQTAVQRCLARPILSSEGNNSLLTSPS